jgi:gluconate 2-dehydrogenase alpha chain
MLLVGKLMIHFGRTDLVVLCAYAFNNTQLLLSAGIGEPYDPSTGNGVVGKNYCHQTTSGVLMFVDDEVNPFIGTGTTPAVIDDFQGDNFDHGGLGFFGGGFIAPTVSGGRPIQVRFLPPGTPRWGSAWKEATARWYNHAFPLNCHGVSYAHRYNYLDLDPTYKDAIGRPLIRMTYNYTENDYKMSAFLTEKAVGIARAANGGSSATRSRDGATSVPTTAEPRTTLAAPSWEPIRQQARSTAICKAGRRAICSSWAVQPSHRTLATIQPELSER